MRTDRPAPPWYSETVRGRRPLPTPKACGTGSDGATRTAIAPDSIAGLTDNGRPTRATTMPDTSDAPPREHRVHGLAADSTEPDWPPLRGSEVRALAQHFPVLRAARGIAWHSPRPLSAAALVETADGRLFVKRHHRDVRNPATLLEEHRFGAHLRLRGVPVPAALQATDGRSAVALGEWTYEVHAQAHGEDRYRDTPSWQPPTDTAAAHAAGAALARFHAAAADYPGPQRGTHILVTRCDLIAAADPLAALADQLRERPGLAAYLSAQPWRVQLAEVLGTAHAALQPRLVTWPRQWTHNDWHVSNLFWQRGEVSAVLDLGLASPTWTAFDLATAIERNAIAWLRLDDGDDIGRPAIAAAVLAGYRSERPLDAAGVDDVAALLPLVHVDFALSEVEYFHAVTGHDDHADVAYHTFLRGHASWFRRHHGRVFLDTLRAQA